MTTLTHVGYGASTPEAATPIDVLSLSPTQDNRNLRGNSFRRSAWWIFTPAKDSFVSFDAWLSLKRNMDPAYAPYNGNVGLRVWKDTPTSSDSATSYSVYYGRGRGVTQVKAGHVYYVMLYCDDATPTDADGMDYVLRVSDYGPESDWVQMDDYEYVLYPPVGSTGTNHPWSGAVAANGKSIGAYSANTYTTGFEGSLKLSRSLGGPFPCDVPDAVSCAWNHARRGSLSGDFTNSRYWSPGNGAAWNGGPGVCPAPSGGVVGASQSYTDHPVGYQYVSETPDTFYNYQNTYFRVWAGQQHVYLRGVQDQLSPTGGRPTPAGTLIWEDTDCRLINVAVAPDEVIASAGSASIDVDWYVKAPATATSGEGDNAGWGPGQTGFFGHASGPEGFITSQDYALPSYNKGVSAWTDLPESYIDTVLAHEIAENHEAEHPGYHPGTGAPIYGFYGLRLVGIPKKITDTTPPTELEPFAGTGHSQTVNRSQQFCAVKITARPARYKTISMPDIPDVDVSAQTGWSVWSS